MTDKKQSAISRRLDKLSKSLTDASINQVETDLLDLSGNVTDISTTVDKLDTTIFPPPYQGNFQALCPSATIDLDTIRTELESGTGFVSDPNANTGYELPTPNPGEQGYFTTYTFTCGDVGNLDWSPGDKIQIINNNGCTVNAIVVSYTPSSEEFVVRIYYPLPSNCSGNISGWSIANPLAASETRVLCCVTDLDGGWCPIGEGSPDLSTLWENVIWGGDANKILDIPIISGGYA